MNRTLTEAMNATLGDLAKEQPTMELKRGSVRVSPRGGGMHRFPAEEKQKAAVGQGELGVSSFIDQPFMTSYMKSHGTMRKHDPNAAPTLEEMQKNYSSIDKTRYNEILQSKPYVPKHNLRHRLGKNDSHVSNILQNSFYATSFPLALDKNNVDLGAIERQNRLKFGVKKPANIWKHEMDDNRITGAQLRLNNFRTNMFDSEAQEQMR